MLSSVLLLRIGGLQCSWHLISQVLSAFRELWQSACQKFQSSFETSCSLSRRGTASFHLWQTSWLPRCWLVWRMALSWSCLSWLTLRQWSHLGDASASACPASMATTLEPLSWTVLMIGCHLLQPLKADLRSPWSCFGSGWCLGSWLLQCQSQKCRGCHCLRLRSLFFSLLVFSASEHFGC